MCPLPTVQEFPQRLLYRWNRHGDIEHNSLVVYLHRPIFHHLLDRIQAKATSEQVSNPSRPPTPPFGWEFIRFPKRKAIADYRPVDSRAWHVKFTFSNLLLNVYTGDLVYYKVFNQGYLMVASMERVRDLFEKRSEIYSDRPTWTMLTEVYVVLPTVTMWTMLMVCSCGWTFNFALFEYGPRWKRYRRLFHQNFNMNVIGQYQPIQTKEAHALAVRLAKGPRTTNVMPEIRLSVTISTYFAFPDNHVNQSIRELNHGDYLRVPSPTHWPTLTRSRSHPWIPRRGSNPR